MSRGRDEPEPAFDGSMEADVWTRVVKRRLQECTTLDGKVVQEIVQGVEGIESFFPGDPCDPCDQMEHLLQHHFEMANNPQFSNEDRRTSWSTVQDLLSKVDVQLRRRKKQVLPEPKKSSKTASDIVSTSTSTTPGTSAFKAPPTVTISNSSHHNGNSSSSRKESATTSRSPKSTRSPTTSLAATSSDTAVTSHSAIPSALPELPSMIANPPRPHHRLLNGTAAAAAVTPPPLYQRHSAVAAARMHEKESTKAVIATSKQRTLSSLPVHPTFQRSLSSMQTEKAASQSPPPIIIHPSHSERVSSRTSPPGSCSSSRPEVMQNARHTSTSASKASSSPTNNSNASATHTKSATTSATTTPSCASVKPTNNAEASSTRNRKRKNSNAMNTSSGGEGTIYRTNSTMVEASSLNKPQIVQKPKHLPEKSLVVTTTTEIVLKNDPAESHRNNSTERKATAQPCPVLNASPILSVLPRGIGPIVKPNENDVLCGRGGRIHSNKGNVQFRDVIMANKKEYLASSRKGFKKAHIAAGIVNEIRGMDPSGRFLKKDRGTDGLWFDIGDAAAITKTGQALREDAPDIRLASINSSYRQQQQGMVSGHGPQHIPIRPGGWPQGIATMPPEVYQAQVAMLPPFSLQMNPYAQLQVQAQLMMQMQMQCQNQNQRHFQTRNIPSQAPMHQGNYSLPSQLHSAAGPVGQKVATVSKSSVFQP